MSEIAHLSVGVDLHDEDLIAGLRRVDAEFQRTVEKINHTRANATADVELGPLKDGLANAKRLLRELEGQKATAKTDADNTRLKGAILEAQALVKKIDGEVATVELKVHGEKEVLAAQEKIRLATEAQVKADEEAAAAKDRLRRQQAQRDARQAALDEQRVQRMGKIEAQAHKERDRRVQESGRVEAQAYKERDRRVQESGRVEMQAYREEQRREEQRQRDIQTTGKIEAQAYKERDRRVQESGRLEAQAYRENDRRQQAELRAMAQAENQAHRMNRERTVGAANEVSRILTLQKQYARLTDQLEYIDKKKPIGREARAKVELDATGVVAKMEALKAELNLLGAHPPVDIKADVNQKGLKRITQGFGNFLTGIANKASGLQDLSVRLGPFTSSLRGVGLALGFLGPTITDLLGAAGSLVGVLGAGLAGAATLGAGAVTGLAGDFLGLKFATRNTGQELAQARTSISAYDNAVLKYGKGSDKAVAKQKEMNSVLKQISPLAREAALGTETFFKAWDKSTQPTQRSLGTIAKQGFEALNALRPMWAASTNEMAGQLQKSLSGAFKFLGRGSTSNLIGGILHDFNAQIPTLMHGLGSLGQAFLNIAAQGAANFGSLARGFDNFATSILHFTQQDSFGATVRRWVTYAGDIMRFFGAAGRVLVHFFGDGSKAGDNFINTMTAAMNRWDRFITSADGKNKIGDFFQNSVKGAEALYSAFKPIVQLFALWSVGLEPAVTVITQIFAGITNAAAALGKFVGLGNPLKTMGATFGALFAVSKIGSFVSMLARAAGLLNEMRKAEVGGGLLGMLRGIGNGSFLQQLGSGRGIAAAGTSAAAEMRAGIISGGAVAAGEMRAAMATGGAAAGAEGAAGGLLSGAKRLILPAGAAAEVAGVGSAAAGAAAETGALATGVAALGGIGATVATGGLALLIGGLAVAVVHFSHNRSEVDKLTDRLNAAQSALENDSKWTDQNAGAQNRAAKAHGRAKDSIASLSKQLDAATPGTGKYRDLQLKLYDAHQRLAKATDSLTSSAQKQRDGARSEVQDGQKQLDLIKQRTAARLKEKGLTLSDLRNSSADGLTPGIHDANLAARNKILTEGANQATAAQRRLNAALNDQAASTLNVKRATEGLGAVSGKAAQQLGALARVPKAKPLAQSIALKYQNPTNAGNVAAAAKSALGAGIKIKTVMQIVADSKNAEDAIKRLTSMRIARKMLQLGISGDDGILSKLDAIDRKQIRQKIANIIEHGGQPTMDKIMAIIRTQIRDKPFSIRAIDNASAHIYSVLAAENNLHDKSVTLTTTEIHNIVTRMKTYGTGPGHAASGAAPRGTAWPALIGEGSAPEWRYNTKSGMAYRTTGPQFTTLDANDAIIPTEPRYRQNAKSILAGIASDLGMKAYRKGKAASPKTPGVAGTRKQDAALGVPDPYSVGAVPLTDVENVVSKFDQSVAGQHTLVKTLTTTLKGIKVPKATRYTSGKKKGQVSNQKTIDNARDRVKDYRDHIDAARNGGQWRNLKYRSLATLDKEKLEADTDLRHARNWNANIERLNSRIARDRTDMGTAASIYSRTGDKNQLTAYQVAKGDRLKAIQELIGADGRSGILGSALTAASSLAGKFKTDSLKGWVESLKTDVADAGSALEDQSGPDPTVDTTTYDLAWLMQQAGLTDRYSKARADVAIAKINNVDDNPGTAAREDLTSLSDDVSSASEMVGVLKDAYTAASATGNNDLIAEAADAYSGALSDQRSLAAQFNDAAAQTGPSQTDMMDTARADLYRNYGSNFNPNVSPNYGAPSSPGDASGSPYAITMDARAASGASIPVVGGSAGAAGGSSGGASTTQVTVNNSFSAPPADPHTWSAGVNFELGAIV